MVSLPLELFSFYPAEWSWLSINLQMHSIVGIVAETETNLRGQDWVLISFPFLVTCLPRYLKMRWDFRKKTSGNVSEIVISSPLVLYFSLSLLIIKTGQHQLYSEIKPNSYSWESSMPMYPGTSVGPSRNPMMCEKKRSSPRRYRHIRDVSNETSSQGSQVVRTGSGSRKVKLCIYLFIERYLNQSSEVEVR